MFIKEKNPTPLKIKLIEKRKKTKKNNIQF